MLLLLLLLLVLGFHRGSILSLYFWILQKKKKKKKKKEKKKKGRKNVTVALAVNPSLSPMQDFSEESIIAMGPSHCPSLSPPPFTPRSAGAGFGEDTAAAAASVEEDVDDDDGEVWETSAGEVGISPAS